MAIDWQKVDEVTLALLHLTSFQDHGVTRAWKGHDFDVMNRLHEQGWIENPIGKAKSVMLTEVGVRQSQALFERYFGAEDGRSGPNASRTRSNKPPEGQHSWLNGAGTEARPTWPREWRAVEQGDEADEAW